ncbi:MAG TPA: translation elongation factor 4 [Candidatus Saccharimonadales bacterium]|nr:translation elongation factor 4 [Candidatus Saccharimonadales bacterium]
MSADRFRNFCIIAHIDHGKSTLADRLLESTHTLRQSEMMEQVLDDMDLERERGITIKSHPISMDYTARDGRDYVLNLIDTPGHVDFSYEVSRSLAACEGALLLVDASQGVQAQTISNLYLALDQGLTILPVVNKIDMPAARVEEAERQIRDTLGLSEEPIQRVSAKHGTGIDALLEAIVRHVPAPAGADDAPLRALIFDSQFDPYRGVITYVRVKEGRVAPGSRIMLCSRGKEFEVAEVGHFKLAFEPRPELVAGEVGYIVAGIKDVHDVTVGDTIGEAGVPELRPLPGYRPMKPMVFSGLYPLTPEDYELLRDSLLKLALNDSSLQYEPETSAALGFGFRCGFLGLLHMEIVQERLRREYGVNLLATVPSVEYHVLRRDGEVTVVENPCRMPDPTFIESIEEPMVKATVLAPPEFVGNLMQLAQERRGIFGGMEYLDPRRVRLSYTLPLSEIVIDFYDRLKSLSKGYASFDYEPAGYQASDLVKLDLLLNGEPVDALSAIVHRDKAADWGRQVAGRLKELIPRHMFSIAIQAAIGGRVVARETIGALRKNVIAKCYGGDITRKRKLLEKQKEGKRRMKQIGRVEVPQEAFLAVLKVDRN